MLLRQSKRELIVNLIAYLYILLFVYAPVSKILDFENFQVQLGQSPLLSAFAGWLSWFVPGMELVIAILLSVSFTRRMGLYLSFILMSMFTVYIYIVLHFSSFVPCSCGGILEDMDWNSHLIFNVVFLLLAMIALFIYVNVNMDEPQKAIKQTFIHLLALCAGSSAIVIVLFVFSENIIHQRNNFVRRFPPIPISKTAETDLRYNSYYFAGEGNGNIYLGNSTAPSNILAFDATLGKPQSHKIKLTSVLNFNAVTVKIIPPHFYVTDGHAAGIFKGTLANFQAQLLYGTSAFTNATILEKDTIALRILNSKNEYELGILTSGATFLKRSKLLQRQIDGLFDSDGMMLYNKELKRFIYLYHYRNQFIVTNSKLDLLYRGETIDTTSTARVKVTYLKERNEKKLSAPPFIVNRTSATHGNLLFVNSNLPGQFEPLQMWNKARIIDVYDLTNSHYVESFYLYDDGIAKMSSFIVTDTHLFAIVGTKLIAYKIGTNLRAQMHSKKTTNH